MPWSGTVLCPACCCGVVTAGPYGFRELSPIPILGLFMSLTLVGFLGSRADPDCHNFSFASLVDLSSVPSCLCLFGLRLSIWFLVREHSPGDTCGLVRHGNGCMSHRFSSQQRCRPWVSSFRIIFGYPNARGHTRDQ